MDEDLVIWDVPYKDKVIKVEASPNASKDEIYRLADMKREKFEEQQKNVQAQYEAQKTPLQKIIGDKAYGITEAVRTVGSSYPAYLAGSVYGAFAGEEAGAKLAEKLTYSPKSQYGQELLDIDPNNPVLKALEGLPPTVGGGGTRRVINKAVQRNKLKPSQAPTIMALRQEARNAYDAADKIGATIKHDNYKNFASNLEKKLTDIGWDAEISDQNAITVTLKRIQEIAKQNRPIRLDELEKYRRMALNATASSDSTTQKLASDLIESIDSFADSLNEKSIVSGSKEAVDALKAARSAWKKQSKLGELAWLAERAKIKKGQQNTTKSEMELLRQEVANLVLNPKRMRGYTTTEREALKDFATGGALDKTLQTFAGLAPKRPFSAAVTTTPAAYYGYQVGGPVGAAIGAGGTIGTGLLSDYALGKRTAGKFGNITTDIATGGDPYKYKSGIDLRQFDTSVAFPLVPRSLLDIHDPNFEEMGYENPIMDKSQYLPIPK